MSELVKIGPIWVDLLDVRGVWLTPDPDGRTWLMLAGGAISLSSSGLDVGALIERINAAKQRAAAAPWYGDAN